MATFSVAVIGPTYTAAAMRSRDKRQLRAAAGIQSPYNQTPRSLDARSTARRNAENGVASVSSSAFHAASLSVQTRVAPTRSATSHSAGDRKYRKCPCSIWPACSRSIPTRAGWSATTATPRPWQCEIEIEMGTAHDVASRSCKTTFGAAPSRRTSRTRAGATPQCAATASFAAPRPASQSRRRPSCDCASYSWRSAGVSSSACRGSQTESAIVQDCPLACGAGSGSRTKHLASEGRRSADEDVSRRRPVPSGG
jgi:hypothetical protein